MTRQQTLKRGVAALAVTSLIAGIQLALTGPVAAGGYRHHGGSLAYGHGGYRPYYGYPYRHGRHGYRYSRYGHSGVGIHGHGSGAAVAVGVLGAGLLLGYLLTRPTTPRAAAGARLARMRTQPASPTFGYGKRVARDCKPTSGSGLHRGRRAIFGGTFCYDANGQGYIVPGSDYLVGYAN